MTSWEIPGPITKFKHFPGPGKPNMKFHDFPGFPGPVGTLIFPNFVDAFFIIHATWIITEYLVGIPVPCTEYLVSIPVHRTEYLVIILVPCTKYLVSIPVPCREYLS